MNQPCIFVDMPKECMFFVNDKCIEGEYKRMMCLFDHRRLIVVDSAKKEMIESFTNLVVNSEDRVKTKSGQEGRK